MRRLLLVSAVALLVPVSTAGAALWWEPRAAEFWTVNRAEIWRLFHNGQCTEWVAVKRPGLVRRMIVGRIRGELRHHRPEVLPNLQARFWATDAASVGVPTGVIPVAGALIVFQPGVLGAQGEGHIAYVERVYSSGVFRISEMNAPYLGTVTHETLPPSVAGLVGVRFIYGGPATRS